MWITEITKTRIIKTILLTTSLVLITSCGDITDAPPGETKPDNLKPIAVISPSTEQSIFVGETLTFKGDGSSDPDSNTPLSYKWSFTLTGAPNWVQTFTEANPSPFTFTESGVVTVSLVVTDSLGLDSDPVSVTAIVNEVGANRAPNGEISYTLANGATGTGEVSIMTGTNVVITGTATDPDNDPVTTFDWTIPTDVTVDAVRDNSPFTANFPAVGTYVIALSVTDNKGAVDLSPAQLVVTVIDPPPINQNPVARINPTTNQTITAGDSITFIGDTSSDPDGDTALSYAWTFVTTPTTGPSSTKTYDVANPGSITFPDSGMVQVSLVVTDSLMLASDPAIITITVNDTRVNQKPVASITPTTNQTITVGDSITFADNNSSDPDGNTSLSYAWTFVTTPTTGVPSTQTFDVADPGPINFPVVGTVLVSLVVKDSLMLASDPATVTIVVNDIPINQAPTGSISHNQGNGTGDFSIIAETSIIFDSTVTDPENDSITYAWIFEGATPATADISGPITINYANAGTYAVSLTANDNQGNSTVLTPITVTVMPKFKYLPVMTDEDGNLTDMQAEYTLIANAGVNVNVVTPDGSWITPMMRYNEFQLPPVIVAKRGTQMTLNVTNHLGEDTTVHWHGFKIPADQDGGPEFPIINNETQIYNFTLSQPAGPLWFHPHAHGTTATQVYNGLAGAFIITDDITENLETTKKLPTGKHDIAMLIQDRLFGNANSLGIRNLIYQAGGMMGAGMLGDNVLVNGVELPALEVETRQYRFRLFNGSNARTYDFALSNAATFKVIGTDGGLLNAPVDTDHIMLAAGERAEIVVDFGANTVDETIMLISRAFSAGGGMMGGGMGGGNLPNGAAFDVMRFDVTAEVTDDVILYTSLPDGTEINTRLTEMDADITRPFEMSMTMVPGIGMQFLINGVSFDMNRVDVTVPSGATEIWNISNISSMAHPFHAHAIQWQILDRGPTPTPTGGNTLIAASGVDLGWKDTVLVQPGETVRIIGRFDPVINVGKYMYHCHILEHEESGMMGVFEVEAQQQLPLP